MKFITKPASPDRKVQRNAVVHAVLSAVLAVANKPGDVSAFVVPRGKVVFHTAAAASRAQKTLLLRALTER